MPDYLLIKPRNLTPQATVGGADNLVVDNGVLVGRATVAQVVAAGLPSTGVTPGTYTNATITVDAKGRITAVSIGLGSATGRLNAVGGSVAIAIAGEAITFPSGASRIIIDTAGIGPESNLSSVQGLVAGDIVFINTVSAARVVTIKHGIGNIRCEGSVDLILDNPLDTVFGMFDGVNLRVTVWSIGGTYVSPIINPFFSFDSTANRFDSTLLKMDGGL